MPEESKPGSHTADEIFEFSRDHPFYRKKLTGVDSFAQAGLTDKKALYAVINSTLQNESANLKGVYWSPSGGSVADFLLFYPTDIAENHFQRRLLAEHLRQCRLFSSETVALNLFGSTLMYRSLEIFNEYLELAGATSLPVSSACPDDLAGRIASKFGANTLVGLPSRILQFARYASCHDCSMQFEKVVFAGEGLPEHKRNFLKNVLGVRQFFGLYGSAEAGVWAYQSNDLFNDLASDSIDNPVTKAVDDRGIKAVDHSKECIADPEAVDLVSGIESYLFPASLMHVEIFNQDKMGFGNIVTTNLVRTRHPLLRYDSGDVGRLVEITAAGRKVTVLQLRGRTERSFEIGGEYYALDDFAEVFARARLLEYQVVLTFDPSKQMDRVRFCLVAAQASAEDELRTSLTSSIRRIVQSNDASFITEVDFVDWHDLARSKTAQKVLKIVDNRPK